MDLRTFIQKEMSYDDIFDEESDVEQDVMLMSLQNFRETFYGPNKTNETWFISVFE